MSKKSTPDYTKVAFIGNINTGLNIPKIVGYWNISPKGSTFTHRFGMTKKPNWFHRRMISLVFGWSWLDAVS